MKPRTLGGDRAEREPDSARAENDPAARQRGDSDCGQDEGRGRQQVLVAVSLKVWNPVTRRTAKVG
jgi:hypothetical protein